MEGIDLGAASGHECRMLLHAVWMEAVNPEDRVIDAVADSVGPVVLGKLHDTAQTGAGLEWRSGRVTLFASAEYLALSDSSTVVSGQGGIRVAL